MKKQYSSMKRWGIALLGVILVSPLFAQTGTLTFSGSTDVNLGLMVYDGQSYSTDVSGVQIDMFNAQTPQAAASRTRTGSFVYLTSSATSTQNSYVFSIDLESSLSIGVAPPPYWVVMSHDGSEFSFKGIRIGDPAGSQAKTLIESYRDGVLIGSVTLDLTSPTYEQLYGVESFPSSSFGNIDELRIFNATTSDPNLGNFAGFNNFVFGTAVLPPSLSVSATTLSVAALAASTVDFTIESNTSWTVSSSETWLTPAPSSGSNNGKVTLTATANLGQSTRSATITVAGTGVTSKTITVTQDVATAVGDATVEGLRVYPNPVESIVWIEGASVDRIQITNLVGEVQRVVPLIDGKADLSSLTPGIYLVRISGEKGDLRVAKIVKK